MALALLGNLSCIAKYLNFSFIFKRQLVGIFIARRCGPGARAADPQLQTQTQTQTPQPYNPCRILRTTPILTTAFMRTSRPCSQRLLTIVAYVKGKAAKLQL